MPNAKIAHVVSFSSEDPNFPAENLTVGLTYKKWKCKAKGDPQSFVILQLEKAVTICGVDIGNEHSAFVEVLVGRSGAAVDDFQTLVAASSFMSAMESKNSTSVNRVRIFGPDDLTKPACTEKWDRIKVICTQPFNKNIQFGLSFLTVQIPENKDENVVTGNLGRFTMKVNDNDSDNISIGSLFAKPKGQDDSHRGVAGQIRDASRTHQTPDQTNPFSGNKLLVGNSTQPSTNPQAKPKEKKPLESSKKIPFPKKPVDDDKESSSRRKGKIDTPPKRKATPVILPQPKRNKPTAPKLRKAFAKLLENVVFVISGYQNPGRQTVRDKAISMGAKYKPDWCPGCTHLICAFPNTPKFNQVRGKGTIVCKQWIDDCHAERKRLPWRRYALDRKDQGKEESEEEICEDVPIASSSTNQEDEDECKEMANSARCLDSGSDTDDEIERVKQLSLQEAEEKVRKEKESKKAVLKQKERDSLECSADATSDTDKEIERVKKESLLEVKGKDRKETELKKTLQQGARTSGSDTDNDELVTRPDTKNLPLPFLPNFYKNKTFYLHDELSPDEKTELNRYITAFDGQVLKDLDCPHIDYLLAENGSDIKRLTAIYPDITAVSPEWVWECNDAEKMVPTATYKIED